MIYLDNAATSFPKPACVIDAVTACLRTSAGNPGRGGHGLSMRAAEIVSTCRSALKNFLGLDNEQNIIFTKNCTEALNLALFGLLGSGDHVVTSALEHNAVMRPLTELKKRGTKVTVCPSDTRGLPIITELEQLLHTRPKLLVMTLASNVTGQILPIAQIGELAKKYSVLFLVDGAQGLGALEFYANNLHIDLLAFPGHKSLLGPQGTGALWISKLVQDCTNLRPLIFGGTGSFSELQEQPLDLPSGYESGTINVPGLAGLSAGIEYIQNYGLNKIVTHKHNLLTELHTQFTQIKNIQLFSNSENNAGICAFNIVGIESTEVAHALHSVGDIAVRAGLHCSPLAHSSLKTMPTGLVRISPGVFTTATEIDACIKCVTDIADYARKL